MQALKTKIYSPESPLRHFGSLIVDMFTDLWLSRELSWRLTVRDINSQYRQSLLGYTWAIIIPLVNTLTWILLNGTGVVSIKLTNVPYAFYVITGTVLWQIFTEAFQAPNKQVTEAKGMLSKVTFPREAIILAGIGQTLFNTFIKILILVPVVIIYGFPLGWGMLLVPLGILSLILSGTALGLLLTPLGTLYQDISKGIIIGTQFWMYITPVVFPVPESGVMAKLFMFNPVTPLIIATRGWLMNTNIGLSVNFLIMNLAMIIILFIGWILYRISMPILIERMNA